MLIRSILSTLLLIGLARAAKLQHKVIYGVDDRNNEDDDEVTAAMRAMGMSTFMMVPKAYLIRNGDVYDISDDATTYAEDHGDVQCDNTPWPFGDEVQIGVCSGTLIAEQYATTAGHCMTTQDQCNDHYFVFGGTDVQVATGSFPVNHVYECDTVLYSHNTNYNVYTGVDIDRLFFALGIHDTGNMSLDFAVLLLDRVVDSSVATPATVRTQSQVSMGEEVLLIGHPDGLPRKYSKANVNYVGPMLPTGGYHWTAPFDSFGGNSGSGVFSVSTGEMVGIHVSGTTDYVEPSDCSESSTVNVCDDDSPEHPLGDADYIAEKLMLDDDEFLADYGGLVPDCKGEWQDGSTVLSAALVYIFGCSSDDDCKYGGTCNGDSECDCPTGYFGPDCSQAKSRFVCNGVGENIDYLMCDCPLGTAPPLCDWCDQDYLVPEGCLDGDEEPLDDCSCHESCASCGFYDDPDDFGEQDCYTCKAGGTLNQIFDDGTGTCTYDGGEASVCAAVGLTPVEYCEEDRCFMDKYLFHGSTCIDMLPNFDCSSFDDYPEIPEVDICGASDAADFQEFFDCVEPTPTEPTPTDPPTESPGDRDCSIFFM